MPARVMPTRHDADPSSTGPTDPSHAAAASQKRQQTSELTVCISLASLFDFEKTGFVTQDNWQKGMATLMLEELGMDPKIWSRLQDMHGSKDMVTKGQLDVRRLTDVVPIDPRVSVLLNAIVKGLVGMRDFVKRSLRKEVKDADLKRNRAVLNVRRKIMMPCLVAWRGLVQENRKLFRRSAHHARYYQHFRVWRQWQYAVEVCKDEARDKRTRDKQLKRIRGAAVRITQAKLGAGWNSWHEAWTERKRYLKAAARLANRPVSMAFNTWLGVYEQSLFLRRVGKRYLNRDLSKAWNSWMSHLDDLEEQARQLRVMDAVVKRYLNRGMSMALNQWTGLWKERQRLLRMVKKLGPDGGLTKAWNTWLAASETSAWLKGCVGRLANNALSKAFNRWIDAIDEKMQMARFAKRAFNGDLARGFNTWMHMAEEAKRERRVLSKFGVRLMRKEELRCWNHWLGLCYERRRLRHYASRLQNASLAKVWNTWWDYMYAQDSLIGMMSKAVNGPLNRAWNTWLESLEQLERMRGVLGRVVDGRAGRAFNTWLERCDEMLRLRDFGLKFANHAMLRAWNSWTSLAHEWRRLRAYGRRLAYAGLGKAVNTWLEFVEERHRLRSFGHRLMKRGVTLAFNAWYERSDEVRRMRGAMSRALDGRLSAAWNTWTSILDGVYKMAKFSNRMLQRELLKGWNKWYAQVEEYWRLRKIARRMRNLGVSRAFEHWISILEVDNVLSRRERGYATIQHLKKLARAWRVWCKQAQAQMSRKRMNDTFKFSKQPEEDLHAEAVDWRASLARGRTRGGVGLG